MACCFELDMLDMLVITNYAYPNTKFVKGLLLMIQQSSQKLVAANHQSLTTLVIQASSIHVDTATSNYHNYV